jgi:2-amino-4-hydroxy-6-hydroxymethyldihydropteridine diphosphokinase
MGEQTHDDWTMIALGGNLGGEAVLAARFADAQAEIESIAEVEGKLSSLYRSAPLDVVGEQAPFLNAVLALPWQPTDPEALLGALQILEALHGRDRVVTNGPRTLDLDLLLVGRESVSSAALSLPHPRLSERRFVLEPMVELFGPDFELPDGRRLGTLLAAPAIALQVVERL